MMQNGPQKRLPGPLNAVCHIASRNSVEEDAGVAQYTATDHGLDVEESRFAAVHE
jgi:hypothetical protein